jgi:hypothetical protein
LCNPRRGEPCRGRTLCSPMFRPANPNFRILRNTPSPFLRFFAIATF